MIENYKLLKQKLGGAGASMRAAAEVWDFVKNA
jgi:hypothetical protein